MRGSGIHSGTRWDEEGAGPHPQPPSRRMESAPAGNPTSIRMAADPEQHVANPHRLAKTGPRSDAALSQLRTRSLRIHGRAENPRSVTAPVTPRCDRMRVRRDSDHGPEPESGGSRGYLDMRSPRTGIERGDPTDERNQLCRCLHAARTHMAEHEGHGAAAPEATLARIQPRKVSPYQTRPSHSRNTRRVRAQREAVGGTDGLLPATLRPARRNASRARR